MFKNLICCVAVFSLPLISSEKEFAKGITSCLLIKDFPAAVKLCKTGLEAYPDSLQIQSLMIRSLSEHGECLEALKFFQGKFGKRELKENFSLLECIAWSMLTHNNEHSEMAKVTSLIGASLTQDSRTVDLVLEALESSNVLIRAFGLRLAPRYNDKVIQNKVLDLLRTEKNWHVRMELLQAVGFMRIKDAVPFLREIVANHSLTQEEKMASIHALVNIYDDVTDKDLELLLKHNRSGFRELGVAVIDHFNKKDKIDLLLPLLKDPSPQVRAFVLSILGTMEVEDQTLLKAEKDLLVLIKDIHPEVAILAAWVCLRIDGFGAKESIYNWVISKDLPSARFAAAVLGSSGLKCQHLVSKAIDEVSDPYVKANLAIGLIKQKNEVRKATGVLKTFFLEVDEEIMWKGGICPMFNQVVPSNLHHMVQVPRYPALMDHLARLDLLNILCIVGCEDAKELVKKFLSKQMWGVVTGASALLIGEGEGDAIDVIRKLLDDENEMIKIQAALALAFYGGDPSVTKILEGAYSKVDWERKVQILEAIGFIGNRDSIPFLLEVMKEPFNLLRTIAASSVIQCLYH